MRLEDFTKKELIRYIRAIGEDAALSVLKERKQRRLENIIRICEGLYKQEGLEEQKQMAEKKRRELQRFLKKEED